MTPAAVLSVAKNFHRAFELCHGNGLVAADGKGNVDIPAVVNLAFAIELGLKAAHLSYGKAVRMHELDKLFEALPLQDRQLIVQQSSMNLEMIDTELPKVAGTFVKWRYIHEESGLITVSLQFLMLFWLGVEKLANLKRDEQRAILKRSSE